MKIGFLKQLIKDLPDQMEVLVPIVSGFVSACEVESGVGETSLKGEEALIIMPCSCNEGPQEFRLSAEDFEEPGKN
jgi:hypothetical protein